MRRREDPRRLAANALALTRKALFLVQRAQWRMKHGKVRDPYLGEWLFMLEVILRRLVIRLETIVALGLLTREMVALPYELVREVSRAGAPPQLASLLGDLESVLSVLYESSAHVLPSVPEARDDEEREVKKEVQIILEEARREARRRMREEGLAQ